uniref:Uncharacterized protein n=1 Tax=Anopheles farauti TaxID=69004 RepID=A0A182QPS4_9DIPT
MNEHMPKAVKVAASKRSRGTSASEGRLAPTESAGGGNSTTTATINTTTTTTTTTTSTTAAAATDSAGGATAVDPSSASLQSSSSRQGSVDGVMQRCGLCSIISSLLRRAMCVGSRRGSGESYYQELAETNVTNIIINRVSSLIEGASANMLARDGRLNY